MDATSKYQCTMHHTQHNNNAMTQMASATVMMMMHDGRQVDA